MKSEVNRFLKRHIYVLIPRCNWFYEEVTEEYLNEVRRMIVELTPPGNVMIMLKED